ncbi:MAG: toll/interleukin-1 receptor domain-containing protein [Gaiellaceae bacterium]
MVQQDGRAVQRVLINYRRNDSRAYANRLYSELCDRFGAEGIFMDVEIESGADFVEVIERTVRSADLMLVVIGPHWLGDLDGRHRLDDPHDYVRLELETALRSNIRIVPILVGNAEMPNSEDLPASLAKLNRRQLFMLSDAHWQRDVVELSRRLSVVLGRPPDGPEAPPRPALDSTSSWLRMVAKKLRVARRN